MMRDRLQISRTSRNVWRQEHYTFLEVRRMREDKTCIAYFHGSGGYVTMRSHISMHPGNMQQQEDHTFTRLWEICEHQELDHI